MLFSSQGAMLTGAARCRWILLIGIACCILIQFFVVHPKSVLLTRHVVSPRSKIDSGGLKNVVDGLAHVKETSFGICVIGAGLSGSVLAERYANVLHKSVLVIDKRQHIAGNCYDFVEPETGILMNLYGAHLFHTESERVFRYVTKTEWQNKAPWVRWDHEVKGVLNGKLLPIPVNINTVNSLFGLNIKDSTEMDTWLKRIQEPCSNTTNSQIDSCADAESMAVSRVGRELYNLIFKPYTEKQWGKSPADLDASVTARIPVRNNHDPRYFNDRYQLLPSKGYTQWFSAVLDNPLIRVALRTDFFQHKDKLLKMCTKTFFTGPIDQYFRNESLGDLEYRSIRFERQIVRNIGAGYYQAGSVVNYPASEFDFTRIVEYKHFLNQKSNHSVIVKEFSTDRGDPYYPVPNQRNRDLYSRYKQLARKEEDEKGVHFVGRLANYKYFNMDQAIENALDMFNKIEGNPDQVDLQECWFPGLAADDMSVVFGTASSSLKAVNAVSYWLQSFPATNASLHLYFRSNESRLHRDSWYNRINFQCDLKLYENTLTPNRGNEAAVFLAYIVDHYENLPEMVVFIHDHGAKSWHSEPIVFFRRIKAFYESILYEKYSTASVGKSHDIPNLFSRFASKARTLSSCYHEGPDTRSPFCVRHLPKRQLLDDPEPWRQVYEKFESILSDYGESYVKDTGVFWSCCASFVARRKHIHQQPLTFYKKSLEAILHMDVPSGISGRWWEYNWYRILGAQDQSVGDLQDYVKIDGIGWETNQWDRLLNGRPLSEGFP